jgi:hypothetical protein
MNTISINNFNLLALLPEIFGTPKKTEEQEKSLTFASAVNGISKFDMPYVYHHLYEGRRLSLKVEGKSASVYYRAHKLGDLPFISAKRLIGLLETGYGVRVKIKKLKKVKYFPVDDIQISMNFQLLS